MSFLIPIILGTTRKDNKSSHVAKYLQNQLLNHDGIRAPLLDLGDSDFPMLFERVTEDNPITTTLAEWTLILEKANGIIIVSPEYKSGYPGSLKNFLDFLPPGVFRYKPIGISTVSAGIYAGTSCLQQLRQVIIGMAGIVIPDRFQVGNVQSVFNDRGESNSEQLNKTSEKFINELIKYTRNLSQLQ